MEGLMGQVDRCPKPGLTKTNPGKKPRGGQVRAPIGVRCSVPSGNAEPEGTGSVHDHALRGALCLCKLELDQGQRGTLVVGQPVEQQVQDAQDLRKVGLVRNPFIRQVEAA